jgi:hypothetical protein
LEERKWGFWCRKDGIYLFKTYLDAAYQLYKEGIPDFFNRQLYTISNLLRVELGEEVIVDYVHDHLTVKYSNTIYSIENPPYIITNGGEHSSEWAAATAALIKEQQPKDAKKMSRDIFNKALKQAKENLELQAKAREELANACNSLSECFEEAELPLTATMNHHALIITSDAEQVTIHYEVDDCEFKVSQYSKTIGYEYFKHALRDALSIIIQEVLDGCEETGN